MNFFQEYFKELTTIEPMDFIVVGIFSLFMAINLYINNKNNKKIDFFEITKIDNSAYWLYNNKVYHASLKDNEIDPKTVKVIDGFGISADELHKLIKEMELR